MNKYAKDEYHYKIRPTQADRSAYFAVIDGNEQLFGRGGIRTSYVRHTIFSSMRSARALTRKTTNSLT